MSENKKNTPIVDETKTEKANQIAEKSKKEKRTYEKIEDIVYKTLRAFSSLLDKILFNRKYAKVVSLVLAIVLYGVVNYNALSSSYASSLRSSKTISDVAVISRYNTDTFEVTGIPETVDVILTGDAANVTSAANSSSGSVVLDLDGLTEGTHEVKFTTEGYGNSVNVTVNPTNVTVTLKKKTTQQFDISYDFINQDQMDSKYSPGTPEFEYTKINVRASKDTLDSIAFVKALIDVSGQTTDFEQDARLVAYDSQGNPVTADIVPDTVHVSVPVTSPSKSVPVKVQVSGEVPDEKAIDSITMDQETVTIYGSETTLADIDSVVVTLDATTLTKDSTVLRPIVLPAGVSSSSVSQITMNITLGDAEEITIDDVPINVINNDSHYKASQPDNKTTTSVKVKGTKNNIENIKADDINVYIDFTGVEPGLQTFALQIEQPSDSYVVYSLTENEYELNVLGETSDSSEGATINND